MTLHPGVETDFGLVILVRSLLSLLGWQVAAAPAQGETEEAMQTAALWVRRPRPCLPLPRRHGVLVGGQLLQRGSSRSTSVQTRLPGNSWNSTFISSSSWFLISRPRGASVVARLHKLAAKETRACSPTHCLDASPCTRLVPPTVHASTEGYTIFPQVRRK